MKQSTLLVINTAATYVRMVLIAIIALVIVRLLYRTFGIDGYGLFVALTASSTLLMVIQSALVAGSQRQLAYEIGRSPTGRVIAVYNATLLVFALSALAVLIVGFVITSGVLHVLTIPAGEENAARWTYWLSLVNLSGNIAITPVRSLLQARQSIVAASAIDLFDRAGRLVAIFFLGRIPGNPMVAYMGLNVLVTLVTFCASLSYCRWNYAECRFAPRSIERADLTGIGGFSGWIVFERLATGLREQGSVIVLNSFFGPVVNAAYDVALRLGNQLVNLASGLASAITPAMTTREGRGDHGMVERLGNVASRYCIYASSLLLMPVMFEAETVLRLWLDSVPAQAELFVRLVVMARFLGVLSWGDAMVAQAKGRIAILSLALSTPFLVGFAAVAAWFAAGGKYPLVLPAVMLALTGITSIWYRPWYVRRMQGLTWGNYLREVLWRTMSAILPAAFAAAIVRYSLDDGIVRLVGVVGAYGATLLAAAWLWGIESWERPVLERTARAGFTRVRSLLSGA